jgi:hypothetical protein
MDVEWGTRCVGDTEQRMDVEWGTRCVGDVEQRMDVEWGARCVLGGAAQHSTAQTASSHNGIFRMRF